MRGYKKVVGSRPRVVTNPVLLGRRGVLSVLGLSSFITHRSEIGAAFIGAFDFHHLLIRSTPYPSCLAYALVE